MKRSFKKGKKKNKLKRRNLWLRHGGAALLGRPVPVPESINSSEKTVGGMVRPPPGSREKPELLSLEPGKERGFFFVYFFLMNPIYTNLKKPIHSSSEPTSTHFWLDPLSLCFLILFFFYFNNCNAPAC